jgi:hypothetical protein
MRKLLFSSLFAVLFLLCFTSNIHAAAKTYYVAGDVGSDAYTAAQATVSATPWKTIQKAADTIVAGDTVNVKGGITYTGSRFCEFRGAVVCITTSGSLNNVITYQAWPGTGTPIVDGDNNTNNGFLTDITDYITISGFKIINTKMGVRAYISTNTKFFNNIIVNASQVGIISDFADPTNIFYNNTVFNSFIGIGANSSNPLVTNNIVANSTYAGVSALPSSANYNLVYNNVTNYFGGSVPGANDVNLDPLFVNAAGGDFSLQPTSPAINAGVDLTASGVTTDILGHSRPKAGAFDIGAYEDTNYYVAGDTGNNSNVGSSVSPWLTIQKAADTMVAGDTVNVKGGVTYTGSNSCAGSTPVVCISISGSSGNPITYQAWPGTGMPVINGIDSTRAAFRNTANNYITISGFKIQNSMGISLLGTYGIIKNNIIYNSVGGISVTEPGATTQVYNNTLYNSPIGLVSNTGFAVVKNNIIVNASFCGLAQIASTADYNLLFNNSGEGNYCFGSVPGAHDIYTDPLFVDPTNGDFTLQKSSPAINAGVTLSDITTDILGIVRPQGNRYDIGAYEYYEMPLSSLSSSGDTKDNVKPVLSFKKSSTMASGISSYSVSLDPGKNKSYSITGIPASGNGSSFYTWRDDTDTKVWFTGEDDSDSSNDTINVYFKGLDSSELTEGKHTWSLTTYDSVENSTSKSFDLYIDKTLPTLTNLSISGVSSVTGGSTYSLTSSQRMPVFTGKVSDPSQGSEKTNSNGTKDTFDAVSSGVDKITLTVKKLGVGGVYKTYLTKDYSVSGDFSVSTPFPLTDGKYEVGITIGDKAGNVFSSPPFYLTLGVYQTISTLPFTLITSTQALNQTQTTTGTLTETPLPTPSDQTNDISKPTGVVGAVQTVFSVILSFFKNIFRIFSR